MSGADVHPDLALADAWQRGFPLCKRPFAVIASQHATSERHVLSSLADLIAHRMVDRIGAVVRPNSAGASTLAAISVAPDDVEKAAAVISAEPFVNHNYQRDHAINLWFVVTAPQAQERDATLQRIGARTQSAVLDLRLVEPYHIDLGFGLTDCSKPPLQPRQSERQATGEERILLGAIEDGLPLAPRPYLSVAENLGWTESDVIECLSRMLADGVVTRLGAVIRHREVGFTANAMAVWDVDDEQVGEAGKQLAAQEGVTLCYRRNRAPPTWRYNLFAMVHGREEAAVRRQIADIAANCALQDHPSAVLFSRRCFLQRGARHRFRQQAAA